MLVACGLILATGTIVYAHATLVSSEPRAGSVLTASPARVRLVFSEAVEAPLARLNLISADGRVRRLSVAGDPRDVTALVAPVTELRAGSYRLAWRIVSADGHPVDGSFVFSVGTVTETVPPDTGFVAEPAAWGPTFAGAPIWPSVLRGLGVGSLAALVGVLLFVTWSGSDSVVVRLASVSPAKLANGLAVAAPILLALHAAAWVVNASPDHRLTTDALATGLTNGVGRTELWRVGFAVGATWALLLLRREWLALVFASAALLVSGASGHAAAVEPLWSTPAKALHLASVAVWFGGLLWLLVRYRSGSEVFVRDAARVSTVALPAALMVTLTGVLQTILFTPSVPALLRSSYGAVVGTKVAGLLVLLAFGAHHRYRVLPRLRRDASRSASFATSLRSETVTMVLVLLAGGLLAYIPTPRP